FTRVLPGHVIALGIGAMVTVIRALNLGPISGTAKMAEQAMAVAALFLAGIVGGTILFAVLRAMRRGHGATLGLALGIALGVPAMLINLQTSGTAKVGSLARGVWVLGIFVIWGVFLGWSEQRLIGMGETHGASETAPSAEREVERIDRRRFLVRLGGATAAITVAGAIVGELVEA